MSIAVEYKGDETAILVMPQTVAKDGVASMRDLAQTLIKKAVKKVVLDFRAVQRIDSQGLGQVAAFHITMQKARVSCAIAGIENKVIRELFAITNLDKVIKIFDSLSEAMDSSQDKSRTT
jgi:anti-anti-sigma factor